MSQFALTRLIVANNRSAWRRVIGIAAGVMVGVALLLLLLGASQGFEDRSLRSTWKNLMMPDKVHLSVDNADLSDDEAAAALLLDYYLDNAIQGIRVATTESTSIRIPGAEVMPGPGEYLASPALAQLIDAAPDGVLAHRYGVRVGIITHDGLEGPDSLVLVQGTTTAELIAADANLGTTPMVVKEFTGADYTSQAYRTVALIGAIAVLIPVLLLIAIVTDLGAAQRTERFASLRLVGATPQQVAQIGAIEIGVTTAVGALVGVGLYFALIPLAAVLELGTSRFYPSDLFVGIPMIVSVVLLTILCATTVSWWRVRHADIGPLGAAREQQEKRPQLVALLPLLVGLFLLGFGVILRRLDSGDERTTSLAIGGFVLTALGLLWAGPLLTWWAARAGQKSARTATQVIGFSRTSKHPRSAFRAVAGMVIATFAVTVFAVGITSVAGIRDVPIDDERLNPSTLIAPLQAGLTPAEVEIKAAELASRPDVEATAIASFTLDDDLILSAKEAAALGLDLGNIDTEQVSVNFDYIVDAPPDVQPAPDVNMTMLEPFVLFVLTDGTPEAIERTRTAIVTSDIGLSTYPTTRTDMAAASALSMENQFAALAYIGILVAAALSTVSLGVSTIAALLNRKRVFGLLRLMGMPQRTLRGIVTWETAIPVVTVLILSIGLGWFSGWAIVRAISERQTSWPSSGYYLVLAACLLLVYVATVVTSRAAKTITASTVTRFE